MISYILNSAVITAPGRWEYRLCTRAEAAAFISRDRPISAIGYEATARAATRVLGIPVDWDPQRPQVRMAVGEEALVIRLTRRLPDAALKGTLSVAGIEIEGAMEIGILRRLKNVTENQLEDIIDNKEDR